MRQLMVLGSLVIGVLGACGDDVRGIKSDTTDATTADTTSADTATDTEEPGLPNACTPSTTCEKGSCRGGVCVEDPPAGVASYATDPHGNVPTTEAPDLSCVDDAADAAPIAPPPTATLFGAVSRFGKGRSTVGIHVDVLRADEFDPTACEGLTDEDAVKACYRGLGTPIGSAVAVHPPTPASLPDVCTKHEECPLGYQCNDPASLGGKCVEEFGLYEIQNVPLETPLILRSYATEGESNWHDTWIFNIHLHAHHALDGRVQYDATMVSHGQWLLVTNTVSLPDIPVEHGAIGGRIRDCRAAETQEGWPIADAVLELAKPARKMVYFNNLEDDTVPLVDRETTDIIGRFAALDVEPGWNRIAGSARVNGTVVSIGGADVYVIPNSLSIVSWPGSQPYWRQ
ncbi:MAG: hypothetical protein U1F43_30305 [Myxococcota bacterium]